MAGSTFDTLSTDVKALIIDAVLRPTDLVNVCLVNKQLHELAVKPLYRYVHLDIGRSEDGRLTACFSPSNIGVKHIRSIHLSLAEDKHSRVEQAHLVTRMILELLPEDILERFSWCPWKPFRVENLMILYRRQRRLKSIEVVGLDKNFLPTLKKDEKLQVGILTHVTKLELYPESRASLELAGFFVQNTAARLKELTVHTNFFDDEHANDPFARLGLGGPEYIDPRHLHDSATRPGLLTRTLFAHLLPFDACEPLANLTSLSLHCVSVRQAADTWCKIVDFKKIQSLYLYQCIGTDALLDQLTKASNLPKRLKTFTLQHVDNVENEVLLALDGFLCLVSGIRDLTIDLNSTKDLPAAAGIVRHGKTLELLNVHAHTETIIRIPPPVVLPGTTPDTTPDDELYYKQSDMDKICAACKGLTQLSIALPSPSIIRPSGGLYTYEITILSQLRQLVTLNISSWPTNNAGSSPLPRSIYETLLQFTALRLFELAAYWAGQPREDSTNTSPFSSTSYPVDWAFESNNTPKLRLIAFGVSDKIYERQNPQTQVVFLRSTCQDAEGKTKLHATPIDWCMKQFVEPVSDVLNSALLKTPNPPFPVVGRRLSWIPVDPDIVVDD